MIYGYLYNPYLAALGLFTIQVYLILLVIFWL
ncbi:hypothetical protein Riv7116_4359 [Rivularia sp. PCC 7116]|nr:hypothetical protein Riv7116_4359 [Rivularia sp. PCC 7116]